MPSVSPAATSNEMPLTAWTMPRLGPELDAAGPRPRAAAARRHDRPRSFGSSASRSAVADQVEAEHGDDDRDAREDGEERRRLEVADGSVSIVPHSGVAGSCGPSPRKPRPAASMIAVASASVPGDDHRRDRVREDVRREDRARCARRPRARRGRSRSRAAARIEPRSSRVKIGMLTIPIAIITWQSPRRRAARRSRSPSGSRGIASMMSITRMIRRVERAAEVAGDRAEHQPERQPDGDRRRSRSAASSAPRR